MDIHRCRFIPYPSSAINALAFSHSSNLSESGNSLKTLRLALGRANGDIEIWNPQGGYWFQESILRGGKSRTIEALVWTQDPVQQDENGITTPGKLRLFSIGYSTVITEWDLAQGKAIRHCNGNFGEIWCLAAQPRMEKSRQWKTSKGSSTTLESRALPAQQLVAGCADGTLALHSTADDDLKFLRAIGRSAKKSARVLSTAFLTCNKVVAGYADGALRVFDTERGQSLGTMTLGKTSKDAASAVLVWSVKVLSDQTIVSGDSSGHLTFWDGRNFTRLQALQCHAADILDLAVSIDGNTVISTGMDRKSVFYHRPSKAGNGSSRRWTKTLHRRYHENDVKVLATYESKDLSVVASGGLDTTPVVIPFREFATEYHRRLPYLEQRPPLQSAVNKRLIMSWWGQEVNIWQLGKRREGMYNYSSSLDVGDGTKRTLVLKILLKSEENIAAASLTTNGNILAIATMSEVKIFRLRKSKSSSDILRAQKLEIPSDLGTHGARVLQFSPDSKWLAVTDSANSLSLYRIREGTAGLTIQVLKHRVHLERISPPQVRQIMEFGQHGAYDRLISHLSFSDDSRILASASLDGKMNSWVLEGYEDLTQDGETSLTNGSTRLANGHGDTHSDDSDDASGHGDDGVHHSKIILGQHWIRNPAPAFPLLPSAPLILSFRPADTASAKLLTNGNVGLHRTRHNAHPHSHDLPAGEDRLLVVTSEHGLYEYNALTGKLSDWSRRNSSNLPSDFLRNRDRVMGSLWDMSKGRERVWLYGASWLGMFDLAKDFPIEVQPVPEKVPNEDLEATLAVNGISDSKKLSKKRKREQSPNRLGQDVPAKGSGAGSRAHQGDRMLGSKDEYRISHGLDSGAASSMQTLGRFNPMPDGDLDEDDDDDVARRGGLSALVRLRRTGESSDVPNGHLSDGHDGEGGTADEDGGRASEKRKRPGHGAFWSTQRYRPILGIVPVGGEDENGEAGEDVDMVDTDRQTSARTALEVALVERPLWDVDLPARLVDD